MGFFGKKKEPQPQTPKGKLLTLRVDGMTCANCVHHVGEALRAVPGVHEAYVDLKKGEARVDLDPAQVKAEALLHAVEDVGYEARVA